MEFQAVLQGCVVIGTTDDKTVLLTEFGLEGQRGLTLVEHMLNTVAHHLHQGIGNLLAANVNTHAMGLHDGRLAITVDDQSGEVVTLTVYKSVGVILGIVGNSDGNAHLECRCQAALPELFIYLNVAE